jgi:hypothetical protein
VSDERTETEVSGIGEEIWGGTISTWGLRPQTPGIYRFDANPSHLVSSAGAQRFTKPQPGLGPGIGARVASLQSPTLRSGRL